MMIGKNFMGRYEIVEKLGSGGTAVVYKAVDNVLNRDVTVKILQEQFTTNQKFVMRFKKEAQAIAALSHPNIVSVYDVGCSDDGEHYLIMEYLEGETLKDVINRKGSLSLDRSLDYVHQILAGLNHAHSYGVIHRDIKPQNIMITTSGQVKIMDFGLAMNITDTTITYEKNIFGSVYYIAPEIAQKGSGDERVDLYSTGIVLYEMLTGKLPYTGDSPISIALQHVEGDYTPIDEIDEDIPYEVARIVDKAMSVKVNDRYSSAQIMMDDIETAADEYDVILTPIQMTAVKNTNTHNDFKRSEDRQVERRRNRRNGSDHRRRDDDFEDDYKKEKKDKRKKKKKDGNKKLVVAIIIAVIAVLGLGIGGYAFLHHILGGEEVEMPNLIGLTEQQAVQQLEDLNLKAVIQEEENDQFDEGIVFGQSVEPGQMVKEGKSIKIMISAGGELVEVPDVVDKSQEAAKTTLKNAGFDVDVIEETSDEVEKGKVIRQTPDGGSKLEKGKTVTIVVSSGEDKITVPNVIGLTKEDAISKLDDANLKYSVTSYEYSNNYDDGYVMYQNYGSGEEVDKDTVIKIKISKGPNPNNNNNNDDENNNNNNNGNNNNNNGNNNNNNNNDNPADAGEREDTSSGGQ